MKPKKAPKSIKNTSELREMLLQTIEQVRSGDIEAKQANTIACLARTVLHSAKLDLEYLRFEANHESETPRTALKLTGDATMAHQLPNAKVA